MRTIRKYIKILLAIFMIVPVMSLATTYALDNSTKIDASNYNKYREELELEANKGNIIDRTTYKDYSFGTYGRVHIDGWNVEVLSFDKVENGYYSVKFKAEYGYKLPTIEEGKRFRFAVVEDYTTEGKVTYAIEGQGDEQDKVGVLTFKPTTSKDKYDATPILVRLVGVSYNETQSTYLSSYAFVGVHHSGIQFTGEEQAAGVSFQLKGSRSYLVKLVNGKASLKVYYVDQPGFKPIETQPSKTGVSYQHEDFRNRYQVIEGIRGDSFGNRLAYDGTIFSVKVYNYTKKGWVTLDYYDYYHNDTHITMPNIDNENVLYPSMRVIGYKVQTAIYEPTMANKMEFKTIERVGLDYIIETKANDYNVQWTATGVDGNGTQFTESSLRLRAGNIFLTPLYQYEYTVRFLNYDGEVLNTQKVLKGEDAKAPNDPTRENYTFEGWDKSYTNIQGDLDIHATYKEIEKPIEPDTKKVKVTFVDHDGTILKEESLDKGRNATAPTSPLRAGYKFVGWDKTFLNVQEDLIVKALYEVEDVVVLPEEPETPNIPTPPTITGPEVPPGVTPTPENPTVNEVPVVRENNDQTVIEDQDVPQGNGDTVIKDNQTPLAKIDSAWALINLICVILTMIVGIVLILSKHKDEEDKKDKEAYQSEYERVEYQRRRWTKYFSVLVTLVSIIVFVLTEDMTLPMQLIDKYTLVMAVILIIQFAVLIIGRKFKKEENKNIQTNHG